MFYELNHIGSSEFFSKEYGKNFTYPLHLHQCFEIIIAMSGEMTVTVENQEYDLVKGDALFIFPNQIHSLKSVESEHMLCIFSHKLIAAFHSKFSQKKPVSNKFRPSQMIIDTIDKMTDEGTFFQKGILYLACDEFFRVADFCERKHDHKDLLANIFLFIEKSFAGDCSLNALSERIGYDYSYLSRYFKKTVGIAFNEYVTIYRLNNACYLMNNTNDTIMKCAIDSGFDSLRSFNRNFKNHFGVSPSAYLRKNKASLQE